MNDALSRVTKASRRARRHETGEERIPSIWRATVDVVRGDQVYVRVPRLAGDSHLGPLPWTGARPGEGDRVVVAAVAGRRDDLIIINPSTAALASRLTSVEERLDEAAGEWAELSDRVDSHEQALWLAEEYFEDIWDRLDRLDPEWITPSLNSRATTVEGRPVPQFRIVGSQLQTRGAIQISERGAVFSLGVQLAEEATGYLTVVNGGEVMALQVRVTNAGTLNVSSGSAVGGLSWASANWNWETAIPLDDFSMHLHLAD